MASQPTAKFVGHRYRGSEDMMSFGIEGQDLTYRSLNPFITKGHGLKAHGMSY